jgi:hypothetical protein
MGANFAQAGGVTMVASGDRTAGRAGCGMGRRPRPPCAGPYARADGRVAGVTIRGLVSHIYFTFGQRQA